MIVFKYTGVVSLTGPAGKVLGGQPDAKTTDFGDGCKFGSNRMDERQMLTYVVTHVLFETGDEKLKDLEAKVFVASGRFILEEGKPIVVEYKISEVTA